VKLSSQYCHHIIKVVQKIYIVIAIDARSRIRKLSQFFHLPQFVNHKRYEGDQKKELFGRIGRRLPGKSNYYEFTYRNSICSSLPRP